MRPIVLRTVTTLFRGTCRQTHSSGLVLSVTLKPSSYGANKNKPSSSHVLQVVSSIHTSSKRSALPPAILLLVSKAAQFGSVLIGHSARNWWQTLTPEQKAALAARARRNRFLLLGDHNYSQLLLKLNVKVTTNWLL